MLPRPGHDNRLDATSLAVAAWHPCAQNRFKLHGVQMPPGALRRVIEDGAGSLALRALHRGFAHMLQRNLHPLCFNTHLHTRHLPVFVQAQKKVIVLMQAATLFHSLPYTSPSPIKTLEEPSFCYPGYATSEAAV